MGCTSCGRGFHSECDIGCNDCHGTRDRAVKSISTVGDGRGAPLKEPEDVKDKFSTGRKRAAYLWPLFRDKPCEWQGKKNCGGGKHPIVGCIDGLQQARHHGPVKQVLRNEPGNVHRICHTCHNRWHANNDPDYDEEANELLKHSPESAEELELIANEAHWRIRR